MNDQTPTSRNMRDEILLSVQRRALLMLPTNEARNATVTYLSSLDDESLREIWPQISQVIEEKVPATDLIDFFLDVAESLPVEGGRRKLPEGTYTRQDFLADIPEYVDLADELKEAKQQLRSTQRELKKLKIGLGWLTGLTGMSLEDLRKLLGAETVERGTAVANLAELLAQAEADKVQAEFAADLFKEDPTVLLSEEMTMQDEG